MWKMVIYITSCQDGVEPSPSLIGNLFLSPQARKPYMSMYPHMVEFKIHVYIIRVQDLPCLKTMRTLGQDNSLSSTKLKSL